MKIQWPALKFTPINLWNAPELDRLKMEISLLKMDKLCDEIRAEKAEERAERLARLIREKEQLYYLRTGRFPK